VTYLKKKCDKLNSTTKNSTAKNSTTNSTMIKPAASTLAVLRNSKLLPITSAVVHVAARTNDGQFNVELIRNKFIHSFDETQKFGAPSEIFSRADLGCMIRQIGSMPSYPPLHRNLEGYQLSASMTWGGDLRLRCCSSKCAI
jgi:hypothetical protein